uniref:thiamine-phosphate kinase n=1 Tax=Pararhizobium sp. IMCC3301 TaxID=3067904 RepID=UPI0027407C68|nr:thiamine-phosphate kinase [Pararhizobium sp. IMCC3301]
MSPSGKAEDRFIQRYFAPLAGDKAALGLHDDAAQIDVPAGLSLVISTDTIMSDIHFFSDDPAASIARKALRVNISDLVAKGCDPKGYFLSLALPEIRLRSDDWMSAFSNALAGDQQAFGLQIMGGDTVMTDTVASITICAFGFIPTGKMVKRSTAKPGDRLYVTGTIGDSTLGLWTRRARLLADSELGSVEQQTLAQLTPTQRNQLELCYLEPPARVAAAPVLLRYASASMDISDGLAGDARTLASASAIGLDINLHDIPHHPLIQPHLGESNLRIRLITGGDDYEILCTVPPQNCAPFEAAMMQAGIPVSCIGQATMGDCVRLLDPQGQALPADLSSFDHFS